MTTAFAVPVQVVDLPFLASEINSAHRQITVHARGMLLEAKRAGDALLAAKAKVKHGEFERWVREHWRCSYRTAKRYMQVARVAADKRANLGLFEGGVTAFLEAHAKPHVQATPAFTEQDAERVLNIAARVERGEGAEKAVAAKKLTEVAATHGTTPEAILERSRGMCPEREKGAAQVEADRRAGEVSEKLKASEERLGELQAQLEAFQRREALISRLMDLDASELAEHLADALIRLGEDDEFTA